VTESVVSANDALSPLDPDWILRFLKPGDWVECAEVPDDPTGGSPTGLNKVDQVLSDALMVSCEYENEDGFWSASPVRIELRNVVGFELSEAAHPDFYRSETLS
jgi:hypothetical protein